jgi:hypothetical protein
MPQHTTASTHNNQNFITNKEWATICADLLETLPPQEKDFIHFVDGELRFHAKANAAFSFAILVLLILVIVKIFGIYLNCSKGTMRAIINYSISPKGRTAIIICFIVGLVSTYSLMQDDNPYIIFDQKGIIEGKRRVLS